MTIQNQNQEIIKATDNYGVEYYTERKTGASGMSQRGLARLANKGESTIRDLIKSVRGVKAPKSLEHWHNASLTVRGTVGGDLQNATVYKAEFCFDVVSHYADKGNEVARNNERILGRAGATLYCQRMTGWTPSVVEQWSLPQTYSEAMRLAADLQEDKERLEAKVAEDAPKVEAWEQLINTGDNVRMKDFADALSIKGLGRNNLIKLLRSKGIFTQNETGVGNTPYRRFQESGYFKVRQKATRSNVITFYTVITPKGQDWLLKKLREWGVMRSD
jgi:phage antirepressor YoqD-like protein